MTLAQINALDRAGFVDALGWVFEASPWVAERAWARRPFGTLGELHAAMSAVVADAAADEQTALLRAHPDLGSRARMGDASTGEQANAGLTRLDRGEDARLRALTGAYRERFGFPFLYAVKGSTPSQILQALEQRLMREADVEFAEALQQVARIARFRLDGLVL